MRIRINSIDADIRLETERTVGEILAGLEQWLDGGGHRLSGLTIDGETVHTGSLAASFDRDIAGIETLDIFTSSLPALIAESLLLVREDLAEYETLDFAEKQAFGEKWKTSPQARLLTEQSPDLSGRIEQSLAGEGLSPAALAPLIEERLRELRDPAEELDRVEPVITEICGRLADLPLDIQTGKDSRAAETIQLFSGAAEKLFRIFNLLRAGGLPLEEISAGGMPVTDYIGEFGAALKELLAAYVQHDSVLVGDLAEYEMAPRLRDLYAAIRTLPASGERARAAGHSA
jgi:hypothetical protein